MNIILEPLVHSEGYCCMYGYLKLCKSRGETPDTMAAHMGVAASTIRYHYTQIFYDKKNHRCQNGGSCMKALFTSAEVVACNAPLEAGEEPPIL